MAIQLLGADGTTINKIDPSFGAQRSSIRPPEVINWNSFGLSSGLLTGVAAAAPVFSLRNTGANPLMVRRLQVGFVTTTAFTAAQALVYQLIKANGYTVSDTGGTSFYVAGANKHRNSFTNITSAPDVRMCTTGALTPGTRVLEAAPLGVAGGTSSAVGASMSITPLLSHDAGDYPLIIAQNEGLVIANAIAMGAAGVLQLHINIEFAEVTAY